MNAPDTAKIRGPENAVTLRYPELGTGPVSTLPNRSAEYFELEREKIFKRAWLNIGRDEDVPNIGDYTVVEIDILNASLIIVRGDDNVVRGFYNACPPSG